MPDCDGLCCGGVGHQHQGSPTLCPTSSVLVSSLISLGLWLMIPLVTKILEMSHLYSWEFISK